MELQATYVPVRGLTLSGNGGYADQNYSDSRPNPAPRLALQYSAQYDTPRFPNDIYLPEADTNYQSNYHPVSYNIGAGANSTFPLPQRRTRRSGSTPRPPISTTSTSSPMRKGSGSPTRASPCWTSPVNGLKGRLSAFATNLFNERGVVNSQDFGLFVGAHFENDRTYGVDLAVAF